MIINEQLSPEIVKEVKQAAKEHGKIGTYRKRIDGGKVFRLDIETGILKEASYQYSDTYDPTKVNRRRIVVEKKSVYVEAINLKNAIKKLNQKKFILIT